MDIPDSIIDPATADPEVWTFVVALKDDDWDHWDSSSQVARYNGCRRSTGRWNLRDLVTGAPIGWSYDDDEIVVLQVLSTLGSRQ